MKTRKSPVAYDWSRFRQQEHGFVADWCRNHFYDDGKPFNYFTTRALILGNYVGGKGGRRIQGIIEVALQEGLITEYSKAI